ncbi:membrane protein insertion efficiency factor YidD [Sulfurirhabdus autotrophica]|uniref:Hemolytic domain-containing protein n=1 Tax=Sulfurirhabdus autotrophica TaxID=1706046 RepID=A0A4R3XYB4_9PROT|nr:hemolytic domain-containing protein [Sulfurirhabdus autotrophica]
MKRLALLFIVIYQRHISPHKGFTCAYRSHTGQASCSALGFRAIQRFGVLGGIGILQKRLEKCSATHHRNVVAHLDWHRQGGFCDLPCDLPCDTSCLDAGCNLLSNCGSPGDCRDFWPSRKKRGKEQWVHIAPNTKHNRATKKH